MALVLEILGFHAEGGLMVLLYLTNGRLTDEGLQYTINHKGLNQKPGRCLKM